TICLPKTAWPPTLAGLPPAAAFACAAAAALAERPAGPLDDNVRVALATGGAAELARLLGAG
ncbi:hypothetical protein PYV61_14405, partial [Roseisolibacter sp. H3M3-2]